MQYITKFILTSAFIFVGINLKAEPQLPKSAKDRININLAQEIRDSLLEFRVQQRRACHQSESETNWQPFAGPDPYNSALLILPSDYRYRNLYDIENRNLTQATLANIPWSGDYWPYYQGLLGNRFAQKEFFSLRTWKQKYDFILRHPAFSIFNSGNAQSINSLSVAEKYDLLSEGNSFPLTNKMWAQGKAIHDRDGAVAEWMGLCHGWAATAITSSRPKNAVAMTAFDNSTQLIFYPDEIKALMTYAWANAKFPTKSSGRRCNKKNPIKDDVERIVDPECFDLNPATWHMVVVNQIADLQQSFIMDATFDFEVWNQPVFSFSYTYFNPSTGDPYSNVNQAKVTRAEFSNDSFARHRNPATVYIVGIEMTVGFVAESLASQRPQDFGANDTHQFPRYYYDLELDSQGNIIGGEWYQDAHPDFVWKPDTMASVRNSFDNQVSARELRKNSALTTNWQNTLRNASNYGLLVYSLVEFLLAESQ